MEKINVSENVQKALINDDFQFLEGIKVHEINGTLMMGDEELPFNVESIIKEKDLVKDWLLQFAVGNHYGINYFNYEKWWKLSANGTRAVLVVDEKISTLFVIPAMISSNITPKEANVLEKIGREIQQINADTVRSQNPAASLNTAGMMTKVLGSVKRRTITDLIPQWFYDKHSITPKVEQQLYYIKDSLNNGKVSKGDLDKTRGLLYKINKEENISKEDKRFLKEITQGTFIFEGEDSSKEEKVKDNSTDINTEEESNPFEC